MPKRVIFCGTPELSVQVCEQIFSLSGVEVVGVVSNPDAKKGRSQKMSPSPVSQWAIQKGIPLFRPQKFDPEFLNNIQSLHPDFCIVVAYGKIVPESFLSIPKYGSFNLHFSLLPAYRGATPVQSALLNGETVSGISLFKLVKKMDAGALYLQKEISLLSEGGRKKTREIWSEMITVGAKSFEEFFENFQNLIPVEQDSRQATFCSKIVKSDGEVDFLSLTAENIVRMFWAYTPWPGLFYFDAQGKRIKICDMSLGTFPNFGSAGEVFRSNDESVLMQTKEGAIQLYTVQKEGKKPIPARVFYS